MTDERPEILSSNQGGDSIPVVDENLVAGAVLAAAAAAANNGNEHNGNENNSEDDDDDSDENDDMMKDIPLSIAKRVRKLQDLHAEQEEIMEKYLEERASLEQKYRSLCQPLYEERAKVISGKLDEEIAETTSPEQDEGDRNDDDDVPIEKGIPQFWVCTMGHNDTVAELLTEEDIDCLEYLMDIQCHDYADGKGFILEFHFSSDNPYFTNTILTKQYDVPNLLLADEPLLKSVKGCTIDWKSIDKCLTHCEVFKKQRGRGKNAGQTRTVKKKERKDSFFHFFDPPKLPSTMEGMDEDAAERLEEEFDSDYDVAQAFRHNICPKAITWFTGQAMDDILEEFVDETGGLENDTEL